MIKGEIVNVFQDPITCKKPEGVAKLIKLEADDIPDTTLEGRKLERWLVEFISEPGGHYSRIVSSG